MEYTRVRSQCGEVRGGVQSWPLHGKAPPGQFAQGVVDARDLPDIAVNRADVSRAVAGEVRAGEKHERVPRVVVGDREAVDRERAGVGREVAGGFQRGKPARRPRLEHIAQIVRRSVSRRPAVCRRDSIAGPGPDGPPKAD